MLVYIKPLSLFPQLHSDRLFGAILSAISEIYDDDFLNNVIDDFKTDPPFLLSSAFPSVKTGNGVKRFFPKAILNSQTKTVNVDYFKRFKKVEYLEESIFFSIINGEINENDILENYLNYVQIDDKFLMPKDYFENFKVKKTIRPNNSINRLNNKTDIFYTEGLNYSENMELFFFIEIFNGKYKKIIESALKFLKDRGFGADISTGKGHFDYRIEDMNIADLNDCENGDCFLTLSRYIPKIDELENINELKNIDKDSSYELGFKKSRDKGGEVRKQVRFFKEGSTFNDFAENYGSLYEVGNKYPAYEYGYAFPLKFNSNKGD